MRKSNWIVFAGRGENKKYLKPLPRWVLKETSSFCTHPPRCSMFMQTSIFHQPQLTIVLGNSLKITSNICLASSFISPQKKESHWCQTKSVKVMFFKKRRDTRVPANPDSKGKKKQWIVIAWSTKGHCITNPNNALFLREITQKLPYILHCQIPLKKWGIFWPWTPPPDDISHQQGLDVVSAAKDLEVWNPCARTPRCDGSSSRCLWQGPTRTTVEMGEGGGGVERGEKMR